MSELLGIALTLTAGAALGARHAVEADHVAAIATLVAESPSWRRAAKAGVAWAVGHGVSLLLGATLVIVFKATIPGSVTSSLEVIVGVVIAAFGVRLLIAAIRGELHLHRHRHGIIEHSHPHQHRHERLDGHHRVLARPLAIGLLHGFAGSGVLTLLIVPTLESALAISYVVAFGVGATAAMVVVSSILGGSVLTLVARNAVAGRALMMLMAVGSIAYGALYAYHA